MKRFLGCVQFLRSVGVVMAGLTLVGCGPSRPDLGEVEGTVTIGGAPLDKAMIYFSPEGSGRTSSAMTDASGRYVLQFAADEPGAIVGTHKVRISTYEASQSADDGSMVGGKPERVPAKYNTATTLTQEVKPGKQTIDFKLDAQ